MMPAEEMKTGRRTGMSCFRCHGLTTFIIKKRNGGSKKRWEKKSKTTNWPLIKYNLHITRLKDHYLFTVKNFLTADESNAFVKAAETIGFVHQGSLGPAMGEAYRDNDRIAVNDSVRADTLWECGLKNLFTDVTIRGKCVVGLNPNIRLYRYKVGQRFSHHIDENVDLGEGKRTHYTLLIYLNGDGESKHKSDVNGYSESLIGSETVFYGSQNTLVAEVSPNQGMPLFNIHGAKCMLH